MRQSNNLFIIKSYFSLCFVCLLTVSLYICYHQYRRFIFLFYFILFESVSLFPFDQMLSSIRRFFKFLHWIYLQYLLNTALYMLEPWERLLFSTLLFAILSTAIYSALVFFPHHIRSLLQTYS